MQDKSIVEIKDFNVFIQDNHILKSVDLDFPKKKVTAIMGPSGCGKSTLIRSINRLSEMVPDIRMSGEIKLNGVNIFELNAMRLRRKIGMVFQKSNPFPTMSIYENVLAGYSLNDIKLKKSEKDEIVEESLKKAALWKEVNHALHRKGTFLSGGQQQRLCIARALAMKPRVLLLDEPTSALDPKATQNIEELIVQLKKTVTIILVTHNIAQASRISDKTVFMYLGENVESGPTEKLFTVPKDKRTEEYLSGKFG